MIQVAGRTLADSCDRSLGIGYVGGSANLLLSVLATLGAWHATMGRIEADTFVSPKVEVYYWAIIMFSQALNTAAEPHSG